MHMAASECIMRFRRTFDELDAALIPTIHLRACFNRSSFGRILRQLRGHANLLHDVIVQSNLCGAHSQCMPSNLNLRL